MANPDWTTLTTTPVVLLRGNTRQFPADIITTQMDAGPTKMRRRSTAAPVPGSGSIIVDESMRDEVYTFFVTSCKGGSLAFDWTDPHTGTADTEARWTSPPSERKLADDLYEITLSWEATP